MNTEQQLVDQIIEEMSDHGLRITEQRKSLARLFAASDRYLSPIEVYDQMSQIYPSMSFDTVYRNLRLLYEMDVLEQFHAADGVKFKARCMTHHHHHIICMDCNKMETVEFCPMQYVKGVPTGFQIVQHNFELYGYCGECQTTAE